MIVSRQVAVDTDKDNNFWANAYRMTEVTFIFGVTIGMFVFLTGLVFAARARRYSQGYTPTAASPAGHGE
jgi:hypothetical protein